MRTTTSERQRARSFVGRADECAVFDARLDDAARADGSIVLVLGDGGIGKTTLVRTWLERARARSFSAVYASNVPFLREPYAPVAELCRTLARADARALPRGEQRRLFNRFLDFLPPHAGDAAEPWQKRRLFVLVREFLERAAASAPLLLAIDDLHWCDPESLELLHYVAPFMAEMRAVLVLALRGAEADAAATTLAALDRQPSCYRISLGPLSAAETRELIFALLPPGERLPRRTIDEICERCAEAPLFAQDLVHRALRDGSAAGLPLTVEQSVKSRLGSLDPADAAVLELASVIGPRIDRDVLRMLAGNAGGQELRVLRQARDLDLLAEAEAASGDLVFRHEFIREAIYARLTAAERRDCHARIAGYLRARTPPAAAAELYRHVHGAGHTAEAAALAERAADEAMDRFAFATARRYYEAALHDDVLDAAAAARVAEKLGDAHDLLGSHREAAACFERADAYARATGDRERQAGIAIRLAVACGRLSEPAAERAHCERALACSDGRGRHAFAAEVLLALHYANRVDPEGAAAHLTRAEELRADDDPSFIVRYHVARAALANLRRDVDAWRAAAADAVTAAEAAGDPAMQAAVRSYVADYARLLGDEKTASEGFADAIAIADRYGLTATAAKSRLNAADMAFSHGRIAEAHRLVREASALQVDGPYARMHVSAVGLPVALAVEDPFLCERLADLSLLESLGNIEGQPLAISFVAAHAELFARRGDMERARRLIERHLPYVRQAAYVDSALLTFARYGDASHAQRAAGVLAATADRNDPIASVHVAVVAAVAAGHSGDARRLATEARAVAASAGAPLLEAFACELAGERDAAVTLYGACGATADVRRLSQTAEAATKRAPNDLSRRETEVAVLIAEGLSNRAIAERLVLSDRTVEHHVAAIFGKLGLRSRAQLAAAMSRQRSSPSP